MNITPSQITELKPNEIFVFGSNLLGNHAGGAAKFALIKFGAEMGKGKGLQGNSYAIPTLSRPAYKGEILSNLKLPIQYIKREVDRFINFAQTHQELFFYVTPIGCGIAGFNESEMAPLFQKCLNMENVALPESFLNIINTNKNNTMKNTINKVRLTESQLHNVIKESVKRVLKEYGEGTDSQFQLGRLYTRKRNKNDINGAIEVSNYAKKCTL